MQTIHLDSFLTQKGAMIMSARAWELFVYPTDTIYGIGAIVTPETIQKIESAKQRLSGKHYSIIAPSVEWIIAHCQVSDTFKSERDTYKNSFPGRGLTLICPLLEKDTSLSLLSANGQIGIRMLDHPFQQFVTALWEPFITSSCNISWQSPITEITQLAEELRDQVDIAVDGGILTGKPSVVIAYETWEIIRG